MTERLPQPERIEQMPLDPPDELLIIANPVSANAIRGKRLITDLLQAHPEANVDVYPTSPDGREVNQKRLIAMLEKRVSSDHHRKNLWIVLATGDGTIRDVAEALQFAKEPIRTIPVLPLAAGNGNDLSSMAHSLKGKYAPGLLLDRAHMQPVYPLECHVSYDDGTEATKIGVGYITFGATAHAARSIDKDRGYGKLKRLVREKTIAVQALLHAGHFEIEEDGEKQMVFERIFANGNRMAKHFRLPGKLEHESFHDIKIADGSFVPLAINAGRLACGLLRGQSIAGDKTVAFTALSPTMMQLDGEAFDLQAGAHIAISSAQYPLHVVRLI